MCTRSLLQQVTRSTCLWPSTDMNRLGCCAACKEKSIQINTHTHKIVNALTTNRILLYTGPEQAVLVALSWEQ